MIDLFRILKLDYKEYVILFKSGSFYIAFDEDSTILNKLFNYKILELKNNIKIGFPLNNIDMVKEKLENLKINYIIVKDNTIDDIYAHEYNSFKEYTSSVFDIISINNKVDKLCNKLKNIHDISIINDILTMIDKVIENYP